MKIFKDTIFITSQIYLDDLIKIKQEGFDFIVNNRIDNEEVNQPTS